MIRVRDIMKERVESISPGELAESARARMRLRRIRHLVVVEGRQVVGVVSDRDLHGSLEARSFESVGDVMTAPVVTATPEMTLRQVANRLRGRSIGCLPVLEEEKLVGIVTTTDLLDLLGRGVEHPPVRGRRAILARRGPRRRPFAAAAGL